MIAGLVDAALRSLLVAMAVWAGLQAFRVRNIMAQKAAWGLVLVAAVVMPLLLPVVARWQFVPAKARVVLPADPQTLLEELQARIQSRSSAARPATLQPSQDVFAGPQAETPQKAESPQSEESTTPARDTTSSDRSSAHEEASPLSAVPAQSPPGSVAPVAPLKTPRPFAPASALWLVYLLVVASLLLRLCHGLVAALRIWHGATPVSVDADSPLAAGLHLRSSRAVSSPVTIGSAVILPADYAKWDSEKLRIVLAHERSHIRQGDFYVQLLTALYAALFWISPLGWWLKRKLSDLAEAISDHAGLEEATSRSSYAQILLEFAAAPRPTLIGVAMARNGNLSRRIERLLNDNSFRHAFAASRRALLAVLLVPVALFAATALIRVEAAQQAPQQAAPPAQAADPAQAAPPAQPADPAQADEPVTGQSHPDQAPDADTLTPTLPPAPAQIETGAPEAPDSLAPVVAPVPPNSVASPPVAPVVVVVPKMVVPKFDMVAPLQPMPPMKILIRTDGVRGFAIAQADGSTTLQSGGYSYFSSSNGDSYAIITGDKQNHFNFSGDIHTDQIDKARKLAHGDFLWFTHDGKSYFIDDPATLNTLVAMYQPIEELGKQQEVLGRQQEALGKQQEALGRLQEQASIPTPDLSEEMAKLNDAMAKLQAKVGKTITQEELGEIQEKIGQLQAKLGTLQGRVGAKQGELGGQQGRLGAEQGKLGAEQGRLGAQQGKLSMEVDRKVKEVIEESLKNGKAKPVE